MYVFAPYNTFDLSPRTNDWLFLMCCYQNVDVTNPISLVTFGNTTVAVYGGGLGGCKRVVEERGGRVGERRKNSRRRPELM